jgi:hypothetical protein
MTPNRHRAAASAAILLLAVAGLAACGSGGASQPSATPTASASPTVSTPVEQASAEIQQLVLAYYDETNAIYASTTKPITDIEQYTRGDLREYRILQHQYFRNSGQRITSGGIAASGVSISDLDLSAAPPSAVVDVCSGGSAEGTDAGGQPKSFDEKPAIVRYDVQYLPSTVDGTASRWFLTSSTATGTGC